MLKRYTTERDGGARVPDAASEAQEVVFPNCKDHQFCPLCTEHENGGAGTVKSHNLNFVNQKQSIACPAKKKVAAFYFAAKINYAPVNVHSAPKCSASGANQTP